MHRAFADGSGARMWRERGGGLVPLGPFRHGSTRMKIGSTRLLLVLAITLVLGACAPTQQPDTVASSWIGKRRREVVAALGQPTQITPLDSGGEILIYAKSGQKHYVFETAPEGLVAKAVEVK